jgi:hypothetical protein
VEKKTEKKRWGRGGTQERCAEEGGGDASVGGERRGMSGENHNSREQRATHTKWNDEYLRNET